MRFYLVLALAFALVLGTAVAAVAAWNPSPPPYYLRTFDPSPDFGGQTKLFYEGWGYGAPAGYWSEVSVVEDPTKEWTAIGSGAPYRVVELDGTPMYGRGWTSIGPNKEAWVVAGLNGQRPPRPKPPYYSTTEWVREGNDWTNTSNIGEVEQASYGYAGDEHPYATGTYVDGPQPYHTQCLWLDMNDWTVVGTSGPPVPIVLKHDIPTLTDPLKVRAAVEFWTYQMAYKTMGQGIRMYFTTLDQTEAYVDYALHFYHSGAATFAWRVVGIPSHPEWENWTDTGAVYGDTALNNRYRATHVSIDCGQITPGGLAFILRKGKTSSDAEPETADMLAAYLPNFTQYVTAAIAIAIGMVDEAPDVLIDVDDDGVFIDNVWICEGINPPIATIDEAKTSYSTKLVHLTGDVVTGTFYKGDAGFPVPAGFAVEAPDRHIGIRVLWDADVAAGDAVDVYGALATVGGERVINAGSVSVISSGNTVPEPLFMPTKSTGGGGFFAQAAVVDDASVTPAETASGLNNVGILAKICGKVTATYADPYDYSGFSDYFYLDDGSGLLDGTTDPITLLPNVGIRCRPYHLPPYNYPAALPDLNSYVEAVGVTGVQQVGGFNTRLFWSTDYRTLAASVP